MIKDLIKNKTAIEKASIKSTELAKLNLIGKFISGEYEIEITSPITKIAINGQHGIEYFAKAWKNGKQVGFGKDGTVEIERFRVFNPRILVEDPNGDIERVITDVRGNPTGVRKLKEDLTEAVKRDLAHTISVTAQDGNSIVKGKIGNTTSTFYSDAGTGGTTVDGEVAEDTPNLTWAGIRGAAGDTANNLETTEFIPIIYSSVTTDRWVYLSRGIYTFDTSSISDTDDISSTTLSLYGLSKEDNLIITPNVNVYSAAPASDNILVAGDFDSLGTTAFSTAIEYGNLSISGYNDFSFNATGIAAVSKAGITKLGVRNQNYDADNSAPTWASDTYSAFVHYMADQTGTTNDPKLVVVHSAAAAVQVRPPAINSTGSFITM